MKLLASIRVTLPYPLEMCAEGPQVDDLHATVNGIDIAITLPPSMGEKTDGRSFFPSGWAWWSGATLLLRLERRATECDADFTVIRAEFEAAANETLRRLLNSYRARMRKPAVYPVKIDLKLLEIEVVRDDGSATPFPEPDEAFFFHSQPAEAPLETSINSQTAPLIEADLNRPSQTAHDLLALDADWLDSLGESERVAIIRKLL